MLDRLISLSRYPQRHVTLASIVGIVTTVKWFSNYWDCALMAIGPLGWLVTLVLRRRRS
ncbi:MAG: hypothetical protein PVF04_07750 [Anaerolineae bacterium]